jgi:catechol 2,3-dioxygenase-like lactoylglutathione lyase family enzyme
MATSRIEHVNITVRDPARAARLMGDLFGWTVRWEGPALNGGHTIHVGSPEQYLALYTPRGSALADEDFAKGRPLNHVGVEVEDIAAAEARVIAAGLVPFNHGDYEPGLRFYFLDPDGIEFEVVSYR